MVSTTSRIELTALWRGRPVVAALAVLAACGTPEPSTPASGPGSSAATGAVEPGLAVEEQARESEANAPPEAMAEGAAEAYQAGLEAFQRGDLSGAKAQFERAVSEDPKSGQAHVALGNLKERLGDAAGASASYSAALSQQPSFGPAILAKTKLLLDAGRLEPAEAFARGVLAKYPDSAAGLTALAEVRSLRGDSAAAQRHAQQALKQDPDFRPAMVILARDHHRNRRLDLALYTLTAILDGYGKENPPRDKNNAEARTMRALIYQEQGKRRAAMEEFETVIGLRPDMVDARLHLSVQMLEAGNAEQARPILEKALEYEPSNLLVHVNLGDAYRLLGQPKDALEHLQWVARKDPNLAAAHYNLGLVYLFSPSVPGMDEKQTIDAAIASFEQFKKLKPRTARGGGEDVDELLSRARNKKAIMEALQEDMMSDDASSDDGGGGDEDDGWE